MSKYGSEAESRSVELKMPKNGQGAKCEKNLVWTWQSSYAGKHDKFAGVTISPDKKFIIASGVRGSKTKDSFQAELLSGLNVLVRFQFDSFENIQLKTFQVQKMVGKIRC